ncbi:RNA-directed DNA polymerase, eukaryota, reverse transcriptase zinc-binding domain protein [Tanacetum coccineum]
MLIIERKGIKGQNMIRYVGSKFIFVPKAQNKQGEDETQKGKEKQKVNDEVNNSGTSKVKKWNIGNSNMTELRKSANKYAVLSDESDDPDEGNGDAMIDKRLIVDEFIKKKKQPTAEESKEWTYDMINYFKYAWKAIESREEDSSEEENVYENVDPAIKTVIADEIIRDRGMSNEFKQKELKKFIVEEKLQLITVLETHLKNKNIAKVCDKVFGNWSWVSNVAMSPTSCRIVLGWNAQAVKVMVIHSSKQAMFCLVETIPDKIKTYELIETLAWAHECTPLANLIRWREKPVALSIVQARLLGLAHFSVGFIQKFGSAHGVFLPYLISDHNPSLFIFPNGFPKKVKSFRFTNYIADKHEFLDTMTKEWNGKIHGCHMFKLVKNLKYLKKPLNNLNWKHGNLFERAKSLKLVLQEAQNDVDNDPCNMVKRKKAINILEEYTAVASDELKLLHQKAKIDCPTCSLDQLGDIVILKLSTEDAEAMVVEVTDNEIKDAIFDIGSSKASGPDGYTSYFFKKAWGIIGKDVCLAIKEFFRNGKLLGESNPLWLLWSQRLILLIRSLSLGHLHAEMHIQDNILLTQELLRGYDRKHGAKRCAMKIDIQKAYDTVNWQFLKDVLFKVGFHEGEEADNSFKYHHGCKELRLTHLCFADDLLMLCNADAGSLKVIKKSLDDFSKVSGLFPNHSKNTIFFGSIMEENKQELLDIMPFKCGKFPMKYLGVPLLAKSLSVKDCKSLIDNVESRIKCWKNKLLSYAGRIQFIASVLESAKGKAKVAWSTMCKPKDQGGLGFKSLHKWNEVLLVSQLWKIIDRKESLWVNWVNTVKLKSTSIWEIESSTSDSWGWKNILLIRDKIKPFVWYKIGNGKDTSMWHDKWCNIGPLDRFISNIDVYNAKLDNEARVADLIQDGVWKWPNEWIELFPELLQILTPCLDSQKKDTVWWVNLDKEEVRFSTNNAWRCLRDNWPKVPWYSMVWFSQFNPIQAFILWLAIQGKLMTQDRIMKWKSGVILKCPLCLGCEDSHEHLFFQCSYSFQIWDKLQVKGMLKGSNNSLQMAVHSIAAKPFKNSIKGVLQRLMVSAVVYHVWKERNLRIFQNEARTVEVLITYIEKNVEGMLRSLKVKKSPTVLVVAKMWGLQWKNNNLVNIE